MPTQAYFIGLGGCGLKTVADLQQRLCPTGEFSEYKFTYVDTDDATVSKINEHRSVIRSSDLINVGNTNPYQVYLDAKGGSSPRQKRFIEWVIPQKNEDQDRATFTLPNNFLADGARGQRMIGRTAVHHRYGDIYRELQGKIETFFEYTGRDARNQIPQIWVVASSCGGTGSSMTMDVLYMIDKIVNERCHSSPELRLVLFMPKPFMDSNSGNPDYPLNAYSYLWELNAFRLDFQQGVSDRFYNFSVDHNGPTERTFPLYKFVIPVDVETSFNTKIPLDSLYPTVAELIYYCNKGTAAQEMLSSISNDQNQLNELTENNRTPFKWTRSLVPYGYRVIKKANEEFKKYLSTRAYYEVLKYGILGNAIPEEAREKAKSAFAKEYILKHLCDIPDIDTVAVDSSLQSDVAELFSSIRISPTNLDKQRISFYINAIEELGNELKDLTSDTRKRVFASIDAGVQKCILENGLVYTKELLNLVDDFYLETVVLPILKNQMADVMDQKNAKKSECEKLCAAFKEKQAPAVAKALNEYRDLTQQYHILDIAISLIDDDLTAYPAGYLEVLRKGDARRGGLQKIITKTESAVSSASDAYMSLAKVFIESGKDALTEYLPDLASLAKGQNDTYWAKDSLFERMYHESIIAYDIDHELTTRERIPVRKNEGSNNLSTFVECVCSGETSVLKLAKDEDSFHFEKNFTEWIVNPLIKKIEAKVNATNNTPASRWLGLTLEESLDTENMLPEGQSKDKFLHNLSNRDRIPVLYPMGANATPPSQVRVMYAGSSENLARELGYNPQDNAGNKFVYDKSMTDRFLIIKMPLGLDFYSYKYFLEIQKEYTDRRKDILYGQYGCHIHKDFSCLDLTKAVTKVQQNAYLSHVKTLFSAAYCQQFMDLLKERNKALHDRLWGEFEFDFSSSENLVDDEFGLGDLSDSSFGNAELSDFFDDTEEKFLIAIDYSQTSRSFTIRSNKLKIEDAHLAVADSVRAVEVTQIRTFTEFLKNLVNSDSVGCLEDLSTSVNVFKELIKNDDDLKKAYETLILQTSNSITSTPLFRIAVVWGKAKNPVDVAYIKIIQEILKGRI